MFIDLYCANINPGKEIFIGITLTQQNPKILVHIPKKNPKIIKKVLFTDCS